MNASLWTELQVWFALRGARERAVVLIAVVVVLGYGWQFLVKDGLSNTRRRKSGIWRSFRPRTRPLRRSAQS